MIGYDHKEHSSANEICHRIVLDIVVDSIKRAVPYEAVCRIVKVVGNKVYMGEHSVEGSGIHAVGFGKASKRMAKAIVGILCYRVMVVLFYL